MRKILAFCLLCNFVFGMVGNSQGEWISVKVNGESIACDGLKQIYQTQGAGTTYAINSGIILCLLPNDKNNAKWLISYNFENGILGKNCKFKNGNGWTCETKEKIKILEKDRKIKDDSVKSLWGDELDEFSDSGLDRLK